jgi:hypothetical protein
MCDVCLSAPCHPRCPNAPEPPAVFICDGCGHPIYEGDDVWRIQHEVYCEHCIDGFRSTAEKVEDY